MNNKYGFFDSDTVYLQLTEEVLKPFKLTTKDIINYCKSNSDSENNIVNNDSSDKVYDAIIDIQRDMIEKAFAGNQGFFSTNIQIEDGKLYLVTHKEKPSAFPPELMEGLMEALGEAYMNEYGDDEPFYPPSELYYGDADSYCNNEPYISHKKLFSLDEANQSDNVAKTYCVFLFSNLNDVIQYSQAVKNLLDGISSTLFRTEDGLYLYMEEQGKSTQNFMQLLNLALDYSEEQVDYINELFITHLREVQNNGEIIIDKNALNQLASV